MLIDACFKTFLSNIDFDTYTVTINFDAISIECKNFGVSFFFNQVQHTRARIVNGDFLCL